MKFCDTEYDGLWIGGYRKNSTANWTWVGERSDEDSVIPESILLQNFPSWFEILKQGQVEKNCLLFNRLGHDVPILLPENCYFRRPFICVRLGEKLRFLIIIYSLYIILCISYDFVISVCQEKFHFRILIKKYFKTLKTHCMNDREMTGNYFCR